jgi:protein gp37
MGAKTGIEWTDSTWNPIRGCTRVSEGCRNCYAERDAYRFSAPGLAYEGLAVLKNGHASWTGQIQFVEKHLLDPLKWQPGRPLYDAATVDLEGNAKRVGRDPGQSLRIFVNSMSDLFHENVTDEIRDRIFAVMALCPQHTFQVLTKRPERMVEYFASGFEREVREAAIAAQAVQINSARTGDTVWEWEGLPLKNVWLGVSVENQAAADERIPLLLQTPAALRFLSCEPLLGPLDLSLYLEIRHEDEYGERGLQVENIDQSRVAPDGGLPMHDPWVSPLDWVICGGESGPGARAMRPEWARGLRDQCQAAGVPFFFKQWGEWLPAMQDGALRTLPGGASAEVLNCSDEPVRVGKKAAGALLDGVEHKAFPEVR